jgi:hypothetical protein
MPYHPNWFWVVYNSGKPLIASINECNWLQTHYGGFVVVDNNGPIFLLKKKIDYPKNFQAWLKIVHFTFSNHLGGFPSGYYCVNALQQHTYKEKNDTSSLPQVWSKAWRHNTF